MLGVELSSSDFLLVLVGFSSLLGLVVYLVFYEMFQRFGGKAVEDRSDEVKYYPVLGGWLVNNVSFPSVTDLVVEILSRAWKQASASLKRASEALVSDWYFYAFILLTILAFLSLIMRW